MPTTFSLADPDVVNLVGEVMAEFHPALAEAGVRVGVLMAANPDGVAIKHGGYPVLACVKVVPLKDRLTKGYDAEMLIDLGEWAQMTDRHHRAVIDHELSHLVRVANTKADAEEGDVPWATDDLGRPKLKTRNGDWAAGDGFAAVVARHGEFAAEYLNLEKAKALADAARSSGGG